MTLWVKSLAMEGLYPSSKCPEFPWKLSWMCQASSPIYFSKKIALLMCIMEIMFHIWTNKKNLDGRSPRKSPPVLSFQWIPRRFLKRIFGLCLPFQWSLPRRMVPSAMTSLNNTPKARPTWQQLSSSVTPDKCFIGSGSPGQEEINPN